MTLTTVEQLAHMLASQGHRITYELQVDCHGVTVGEKLWHYPLGCRACELVPKVVHDVREAGREGSHVLLEDSRINL